MTIICLPVRRASAVQELQAMIQGDEETSPDQNKNKDKDKDKDKHKDKGKDNHIILLPVKRSLRIASHSPKFY